MDKGKLATTLLALTISVLCLHSIDSLNSDRAGLTESERDARNYAASSLYAKLATLSQPLTSSDITRVLHEFILQDSRVEGATLFDVRGNLIAQLGNGNDSLIKQPIGKPVAHIPIGSGDSGFGHALLSFHSTQNTVGTAFHYIALAGASVLLTMLIFGLFSIYIRTALIKIKLKTNSI